MDPAAPPPIERRRSDRRCRPTPMLSRYWLRGRRRAGRRDGERAGIYVDVPRRDELLWAGVLAALCALDLLLTLVHVGAGGGEANPVMAAVLDGAGPGGFAAVKLVAAVPATVFLLVHVRFRGVLRALQVMVLVYAVLMVWHGVVAADRMVA